MKPPQNSRFLFRFRADSGSELLPRSRANPLGSGGKISTFTVADRKVRPFMVGNAPLGLFDSEIAEEVLHLLPKLITAALVLLLLVWIGWMLLLRHSVKHRERIYLVPTETFDPTPETIEKFASSLTRARRIGNPKRASGIRVLLESETDGQMTYALEFPEPARAAVTAGLFPNVARVEPDPEDGRLPKSGGEW